MYHHTARTLFVGMLVVVTVIQLQGQRIIHVPLDHPSVQSAVDSAGQGDTVLIDEGHYYVNLRITKNIVLGSRYLVDGDTSHISRTILDGGHPSRLDSNSVIMLIGGTDSTMVITGFTIQNGHGTWQSAYDPVTGHYSRGGGGIYLASGGVTIRKNTIRNNWIESADFAWGGGIAVYPVDAPTTPWVIEHNVIEDNWVKWTSPVWIVAGATGGGVTVSGTGRFADNIVRRNSAAGTDFSYGAGGGIEISASPDPRHIDLIRNTISRNQSDRGGGVLAVSNAVTLSVDVTFMNNLIVDNVGGDRGSALRANGGGYKMINNTIAGNVGPTSISLADGNGPIALFLLNNLVWDSLATDELNTWGPVWAQSNNVRLGAVGFGNMNRDPIFVPHDSPNPWALSAGSPCIDAGTPSAALGDQTLIAPPFDLGGMPRSVGAAPDIGAYEFTPATTLALDAPAAPDVPMLRTNYPNPFNSSTVISFSLQRSASVRLTVVDLLGREVGRLVDGARPAGDHLAPWNAEGVATGVYTVRLEVGGQTSSRRMLLIR